MRRLSFIAFCFAAVVAPAASARTTLVLQAAHNAPVDAAFSPDGRYLVTAGDSSLKIWSAEGRLLRDVGLGCSVVAMSIAVDARFVAGGCDDMIVIAQPDGTIIRKLPIKNRLKHVRFLADGSLAATTDNNLLFFGPDGAPGKSVEVPGAKYSHISGLSTTADRRMVVLSFAAGSTTEVDVYRTDGSLFRKGTSAGNGSETRFLTVAPDDSVFLVTVAATGRDEGRRFSADLKKASAFTGASWRPEAIAVSLDGKRVAWFDEVSAGMVEGNELFGSLLRLGGPDGKAKQTVELGPLLDNKACSAKALSYSPDGKRLLLLCGTRTLLLHSDGKLIRQLGASVAALGAFAVSPDGSIVAVSRRDAVELWTLDARLLRTMPQETGEIGEIAALAFSPDGAFLFVGGERAVIQQWSVAGSFRQRFEAEDYTREIVVSGDGKLLAAYSKDPETESRLVRTFSIATGKRVKKFHNHELSQVGFGIDRVYDLDPPDKGTVQSYDLNGDPKERVDGVSGGAVQLGGATPVFAIQSSGQLRLFDLAGKSLRSFAAPGTLSFAPGGDAIAALHDGQVEVFDGKGVRLGSFALPGSTPEVSFGAGGLLFASAGGKRQVFRRNGTLVGALPSGDTRVFLAGDGTTAFSIDQRSAELKESAVGGMERISLVALDGEWVASDSKGRYDSSPAGGRYLAMVDGMLAFGVDQFAARANRPDVLLEELGSKDPAAISYYRTLFQKRLRRLGITEEQLSQDLHVPTAEIVSSAQDGAKLQLKLRFSDDRGALARYSVFINDVPVFGGTGKPLSGKEQIVEETVALTRGENKVEVSCTDAKGAESFRVEEWVQSDGAPRGDLYLLAFGVSAYRDPRLTLGYAAKDAQDLVALFSRMEGTRFRKVHARAFVNEEVTVPAIRGAKALLSGAGPDDTLVVFIAGHGLHDQDADATYYYLTHEADPDHLSVSAARFEEVEDLLQGVAPRNKLFLMDTCESGEVDKEDRARALAMATTSNAQARGIKASKKGTNSAASSDSAQRHFLRERDRFIYSDLSRRSGAIVLSSSRGGEFSYERSDLRNGVFTYELIAGLTSQKADADHDGLVTTDELRRYLARAVAADTDGLQNPVVDRDNLFQKFGFPVIH